jgi:alanine racemase
MTGERPAVATIRLDAIRENYACAAKLAGSRQVIAVVKADAYGHGSVPVARTLVEAGCRWLAVHSVGEGVALRDAGIDVTLMAMGGVHDAAEARIAVERGVEPALHRTEQAAWIAAAADREPARVHVEVDTGMTRVGASGEQAPGLLAELCEHPKLVLASTYTHLARADESDLAPSLDQLARFRRVVEAARAAGVAPGVVHAANSAGLAAGDTLDRALPEAGAVRPGLMLYGAQPSAFRDLPLVPAMTLSTRVAAVHDVAPDTPVGYAALHRTSGPTRIATLAIGYADGVPVSASNRGAVRIRGHRLPMVGRVSMDFLSVDCGDHPVEVGDEATLFGEGLPIEEVAEAAATLSYEILVRVGARVRREYTS